MGLNRKSKKKLRILSAVLKLVLIVAVILVARIVVTETHEYYTVTIRQQEYESNKDRIIKHYSQESYECIGIKHLSNDTSIVTYEFKEPDRDTSVLIASDKLLGTEEYAVGDMVDFYTAYVYIPYYDKEWRTEREVTLEYRQDTATVTADEFTEYVETAIHTEYMSNNHFDTQYARRQTLLITEIAVTVVFVMLLFYSLCGGFEKNPGTTMVLRQDKPKRRKRARKRRSKRSSDRRAIKAEKRAEKRQRQWRNEEIRRTRRVKELERKMARRDGVPYIDDEKGFEYV